MPWVRAVDLVISREYNFKFSRENRIFKLKHEKAKL